MIHGNNRMISFISLLAMSAILAACFFVRRHQIRRDRAPLPQAREFHGMSSQLVKAMPSLIFTKVQEDNCTSATCTICLEDYSVGEKLRVLPCRHSMFLTHLFNWCLGVCGLFILYVSWIWLASHYCPKMPLLVQKRQVSNICELKCCLDRLYNAA